MQIDCLPDENQRRRETEGPDARQGLSALWARTRTAAGRLGSVLGSVIAPSGYLEAVLFLLPPVLVFVLIDQLRRQEKRELQVLARLLAGLKEERSGPPRGNPPALRR